MPCEKPCCSNFSIASTVGVSQYQGVVFTYSGNDEQPWVPTGMEYPMSRTEIQHGWWYHVHDVLNISHMMSQYIHHDFQDFLNISCTKGPNGTMASLCPAVQRFSKQTGAWPLTFRNSYPADGSMDGPLRYTKKSLKSNMETLHV
jgi:hypothetical protein